MPSPAPQQLFSRTPARSIWWILGLGIALSGAVWFLVARSGQKTETLHFTTEPATIATLVVKVSATGKVQPTNKVDVGSELSGIVEHVFVDTNDAVQKGQVLARLDLAKLRDNVARSKANLGMTQAQVLQAQATLAETRAALDRARQLARLSGGKLPSRQEMDTAQAGFKRAEANEASARASVAQAQATLRSDETNLEKASIRSPINGVVLTRKVEPGQTVAASFQAPVLFTLAEDLSKMELQVDVDEADVGRVSAGQRATFNVDAWPGRRFDALITKVNYGSQEKDGVVSYLTTLEVNNNDLSLRPGMTGTAEIVTMTRENVLLVPNAALRFSPPDPAATPKKTTGMANVLMPRPPATPKITPHARDNAPRLWVLRDGQPVPVDVQTGATNGRMTEIVNGTLEANMPVITEATAP